MKTLYARFLSILLTALVFTMGGQMATAQTETLSTGSYIINMGITPQTQTNALKPYGLMYDLLKNNNVPIKWVISQTKVKDGADFTYNGVQYKGGTFIIPAVFRSAAVNAKMTSYGVSGTTTTSPLTVDVTYTLTAAPNWTLDDKNGAIAEGFFRQAGIPSSAYNYKDPQLLAGCDDIFVMPHADPTWATHSNLYNWNRNNFGAVWAGCHAVSVLETRQWPLLGVQLIVFGTVLAEILNQNDSFPAHTNAKENNGKSFYIHNDYLPICWTQFPGNFIRHAVTWGHQPASIVPNVTSGSPLLPLTLLSTFSLFPKETLLHFILI